MAVICSSTNHSEGPQS